MLTTARWIGVGSAGAREQNLDANTCSYIMSLGSRRV
jgi:hypothetical protein